MNITPEWVEHLPQDINGIKIYRKNVHQEIGLQKLGPEVLQDAFFEQERPNRNKEGRKVHWYSLLSL